MPIMEMTYLKKLKIIFIYQGAFQASSSGRDWTSFSVGSRTARLV